MPHKTQKRELLTRRFPGLIPVFERLDKVVHNKRFSMKPKITRKGSMILGKKKLIKRRAARIISGNKLGA